MLKDRGQIKKSLEKAFHESQHVAVAGLPRSTENRCELSIVGLCMGESGILKCLSCIGTGTLRVAVATTSFVI